jgi:excisionase family DNA binding protein
MMNSTQQAVDFLGHQITAVEDEQGKTYVPLDDVRRILDAAQNGEMRLPEREPAPRFLTAIDVGQMLGISARTVNRLVKDGRIGCVQITHSRRLFTKELVEEFIGAETAHRDPSWDENPVPRYPAIERVYDPNEHYDPNNPYGAYSTRVPPWAPPVRPPYYR